jgi:parallel beta helix pectate lyase-like protein
MNKFRFTINAIAIAAFVLAVASLAQAQATRTWVSGVGDDANPCSRTAPCKTFAGAISKTATDGEIDALDPGGFGTVTITKAITIDGNGWGSILAAGTNGVNVNVSTAGSTNSVQLRNISINGAGTGFTGVNITAGTNTTVEVENCVIFGFRGNGNNSRGISDSRAVGGKLIVINTLIKNNSGSGVVSIGTSAVTTTIENCQSVNNTLAGFVSSGSGRTMVIRNSVANQNGLAGYFAESSAKLDLFNCLTSLNAQGIDSESSAEVRAARCSISRNTSNGLNLAGGTILSYGNNEISANAGNEAFSGGGPTLH